MAAKRVLVFSLAYYPFVGGAEVALREIIERLAQPQLGAAGDDYQFEIITVNLTVTRCRLKSMVRRWCDVLDIVNFRNTFSR